MIWSCLLHALQILVGRRFEIFLYNSLETTLIVDRQHVESTRAQRSHLQKDQNFTFSWHEPIIFLYSRGCEYRRGMYSHRMNSPKNLAPYSGISSQKYLPVFARVRIQAPHVFVQKLILQEFFPACIGFVAGGLLSPYSTFTCVDILFWFTVVHRKSSQKATGYTGQLYGLISSLGAAPAIQKSQVGDCIFNHYWCWRAGGTAPVKTRTGVIIFLENAREFPDIISSAGAQFWLRFCFCLSLLVLVIFYLSDKERIAKKVNEQPLFRPFSFRPLNSSSKVFALT